MKDEVEKLKIILEHFRSPYRSDSLVSDEVRIQEATQSLLALLEKAQVEAVRAELRILHQQIHSETILKLIEDRLANLKEDGETK